LHSLFKNIKISISKLKEIVAIAFFMQKNTALFISLLLAYVIIRLGWVPAKKYSD